MDHSFPNPNLQPSKKDARSKHLESGFNSNILFQYELDADLKRAIISYGNIFFKNFFHEFQENIFHLHHQLRIILKLDLPFKIYNNRQFDL